MPSNVGVTVTAQKVFLATTPCNLATRLFMLVTCPRCDSADTYAVDQSRPSKSQLWECGDCQKKFFLAKVQREIADK